LKCLGFRLGASSVVTLFATILLPNLVGAVIFGHASFMPRHNTGPPMTLGNMRENGVRRLSVSCWICHHSAVVDVDGYADPVPVPAFGPRMVCTRCGIVGADARPNWTDRPARETMVGSGWQRHR
jgi:hypothetical protein